MTQNEIERVREQPVEVLEPDEIIEVESKPVAQKRPASSVRTTEVVSRGLDLLVSVGRLVLRILQERGAGSESPISATSRSTSSSPTPVDETGGRGVSSPSDRGARRRRQRRRGGS